MPDVFTGQEFAKSLSAGHLKKSIVKVGMAKKSDDSPDTILFAEGHTCGEWISIPVSVIEQVRLLGNVTCRDHAHPLVAIQFKEPEPNNEAARVFAELARRGPATRPVQPSRGARGSLSRNDDIFDGGGGGIGPVSWCFDSCATEFDWCLKSGRYSLGDCIYGLGRCFGTCGELNPPIY